MNMGLFDRAPVVYYYLQQGDKRDPYEKQGPYNLETMALLYKEEIVTKTTMIWTNERIRRQGHIRSEKVPGWNPIGHMPEEWQQIFRIAVSNAPDRTQQTRQIPAPMPHQGNMPMEDPPSYHPSQHTGGQAPNQTPYYQGQPVPFPQPPQ